MVFERRQAAHYVLPMLLGSLVLVHADKCGDLVKDINFDYAKSSVPYSEALAVRDWAPYTYLDGFWGDPNTKGANNQRAELITLGRKSVLQVLLPKGCVAEECGMQSKSVLPRPMEEATLQYMVKFGPDFDWVHGGKLPGLCGGECLASCTDVSGLTGWSVSTMWRPCQWPLVAAQKQLACDGGKLAAYVYHMYKQHWCGDDFDFTNEHARSLEDGTRVNFFEPAVDRWYTITTYVKMNTAGPVTEDPQSKRDGVLKVWIDGTLVVDKPDLAFRVYNNVTVDTLTMNSFFGGSSDSFRAHKDEVIQFDGFKVWEGSCPPKSGQYDESVDPIVPSWPGMKLSTETASTLKASFTLENVFVGGGCASIKIRNTGERDCMSWVVQINTRPSWGLVSSYTGLELRSSDAPAGWLELAPVVEALERIKAGDSMEYVGFCAYTTLKAQYAEAHFYENIAIGAFCTKSAPALRIPTKAQLPVTTVLAVDPVAVASAANAAVASAATVQAAGVCAGSRINPSYSAKIWPGKVCLDMTLVNDGAPCHAFSVALQLDPTVVDVQSVYAARTTLRHDDFATGTMSLSSPDDFAGLECEGTWQTTVCVNTLERELTMTEDQLEGVINRMTAGCDRPSAA